MIRYFLKLFKALHSDTEPWQLTLAAGFGMVMGLTPFFGIHSWILLALVLLLRVNIAMFVLGWAVFGGIAYMLDPTFSAIGASVLESPALKGLWTTLYNSAFWRSTRFNDTVMMGSTIVALAAFVPLCAVLGLSLIHI